MTETSTETAFTTPVAAPAYGPPPYHMQESRIVLVTCRVNAARLRASIPEPIGVKGDGIVSFFVGDMVQLPHCGRFHEGGALVPTHFGSVEASYTPYLWTSTDEALMVGREVYGMPKVLCDDTPLDWQGNQVTGTVYRRGDEVLRLGVNLEREVDPAGFPRNAARLTLRNLPGVSGGAAPFQQLLHIPLQGYEILEAWEGRGFARLHPSAFSRVHELAPLEVLNCYYARARWTLAEAEVLWTRGEPERAGGQAR